MHSALRAILISLWGIVWDITSGLITSGIDGIMLLLIALMIGGIFSAMLAAHALASRPDSVLEAGARSRRSRRKGRGSCADGETGSDSRDSRRNGGSAKASSSSCSCRERSSRRARHPSARTKASSRRASSNPSTAPGEPPTK